MKYYIIAGEASGDLHAGNLLRELKLLDANYELVGPTGPAQVILISNPYHC